MNQLITQLLGGPLNPSIRKFPGNLPVSLSRDMLEVIPFGYLWSPKADGIRAFCFMDDVGTIVCTFRDDTVQVIVQGVLPDMSGKSSHINNWIREFLRSTGRKKLSVFDVEIFHATGDLVIFDTIMMDNISMTSFSYHIRMSAAYHYMTSVTTWPMRMDNPHVWSHSSMCKFMMPRPTAGENMSRLHIGTRAFITVKPSFIYQMAKHALRQLKFLRNTSKVAQLKDDGIIFMRMRCHYTVFRSSMSAVLKFKPYERITVDFRVTSANPRDELDQLFGADVKYTRQSRGNVVLSCTPVLEGLKSLNIARGTIEGESLLKYINKICEFSWDDVTGSWRFVMVRDKKDSPNAPLTVVKTINNLVEKITVEQAMSIDQSDDDKDGDVETYGSADVSTDGSHLSTTV